MGTNPQFMTPIKAQPSGQAAVITAHIEELDKQIAAYKSCVTGQLQKVTIVVNGRNGTEKIGHVFNFPAGNVPLEIKDFFIHMAAALEAEKSNIYAPIAMLRLGNNIVTLDDLVKDYTAGEIPSISPDDVAALKSLKALQSITVLINEKPHTVQRIN